MKPQHHRQFRALCKGIVEWGGQIPEFVAAMSFEEFEADRVTHLAVWKCVEVLGEAAAKIMKLDPGIAEEYPALQLKGAYAMRNVLTHGYGTVDLAVLWQTIHDFVPLMVSAARAIVEADDLEA